VQYETGKPVMRIRTLILCLICTPAATFAAEPGIEIQPDALRRFEYSDDFSTRDFSRTVSPTTSKRHSGSRQPDELRPGQRADADYRFFGSATIKTIQVEVAQRAAGQASAA